MGHVLNGNGISPSDVKITAIKEVLAQKNKQELKAYLGLLNFYRNFVPNLSAELKPLYDLLRDSTKWKWTAEAERVFQTSKGWLTQNTVLAHYDPSKDLGLVCDASAYGVGAILFHKEGPVERPIAFASRILSKSEQAYAHIEKEALAVVFGLRRFHKYLFGRSFSIYSDHQPLLGLLAHDKPVPAMAAARVQRWALLLAAYNYRWVYRKASEIANADALSRLPLQLSSQAPETEDVHFFLCSMKPRCLQKRLEWKRKGTRSYQKFCFTLKTAGLRMWQKIHSPLILYGVANGLLTRIV